MSDAPTTAHASATSGRFGHRLGRSLALTAAVILFLLVLLTCADVFGRYVLNAPIPGTAELVEQMMGALIFLALPLVTLRDFHITIDLLDPVTPRRFVAVRDIAINLISAAFLGAIALRMWTYAGSKIRYGDITQYLHIPLYPIAYLLCALLALTTALLVLIAAQSIARLLSGTFRS